MRTSERFSFRDRGDKTDGVGDNFLNLLMVEGREGFVSRLEIENLTIVTVEGHSTAENFASRVRTNHKHLQVQTPLPSW